MLGNVQGGGRFDPPPPAKRGLNVVLQLGYEFYEKMANVWSVEELSISFLMPHTSWYRQQFLNSMMPKSSKCAFSLAADFDIGLLTGLALKTVFFL